MLLEDITLGTFFPFQQILGYDFEKVNDWMND